MTQYSLRPASRIHFEANYEFPEKEEWDADEGFVESLDKILRSTGSSDETLRSVKELFELLYSATTDIDDAVDVMIEHDNTRELNNFQNDETSTSRDGQMKLLGRLRILQKQLRAIRNASEKLNEAKYFDKFADVLKRTINIPGLQRFYDQTEIVSKAYASAHQKKVVMELGWEWHRFRENAPPGDLIPFATEDYEDPLLHELNEMDIKKLRKTYQNVDSNGEDSYNPRDDQTFFYIGGPGAEWGGNYDWRSDESSLYQKTMQEIRNAPKATVDDEGTLHWPNWPRAREEWNTWEKSMQWMNDNLYGKLTMGEKTRGPYCSRVTQLWEHMRRVRSIAKALPEIWKEDYKHTVAFKKHIRHESDVSKGMVHLHELQSSLQNVPPRYNSELPIRLNELEDRLLDIYNNIISGRSEDLPLDIQCLQREGLQKLETWRKATVIPPLPENEPTEYGENGETHSTPPRAYFDGISSMNLKFSYQPGDGLSSLNDARSPHTPLYTLPKNISLSWLSPAAGLRNYARGQYTFDAHRLCTAYDDPPPGTDPNIRILSATQPPLTTSVTVVFDTPFSPPPTVRAWISEVKAYYQHDRAPSIQYHDHQNRFVYNGSSKPTPEETILAASVSNIRSTSFTLSFTRAAHFDLSLATINWIAYPSSHPRICGGVVRKNKNKNKGHQDAWIGFPTRLEKVPGVMLGYSKVHVRDAVRLDLRASVLANTTTGVLARVEWGDECYLEEAEVEVVVVA